MFDWLIDNAAYIAFVLIFAIVAFVIVGLIVSGYVNETNRIDNGVIVNKWMDAGGTYYNSDKNGGRFRSYPATYYFTIQGEKDGETVDYTFEVTAEEYEAYKIGDEYRR